MLALSDISEINLVCTGIDGKYFPKFVLGRISDGFLLLNET